MKSKSLLHHKSYYIVYALLTSILFLNSCNPPKPSDEPFKATPYTLKIPKYFPTILNIPDDNPMTVEGVKLGRYLFYDGRLRGYNGDNPDSLMSCATCHIQTQGFECGLNHPKYINGKTHGINGKPTPHSMLPLCNLVFNNNGYFWNGMIYTQNSNPKRRNIENIVSMGITVEHEMNSSIERAVTTIKNISIYPPMFKAAFGTEEVTIERIEKAIAQFIRTLISGNSKFDRYIRGIEDLSSDELAGFVLFTTEEGADCFHCHGSDGNLLMTTNQFYNNGLDSVFNDPRDRYSVSGNQSDIGAYKAPSLRNIEFTAPYMHDGRFLSLDEVIDFYSEGLHVSTYIHPLMHKISDGGALLTPKEKRQLKAFLLTLTDTEFLTNPDFAKPDDIP